ncbi:glycoside hydrolase family protein [Candidatus Synechococcus calcipolaris G9]|uniref:Glycoside hydrolase family protein n=1 Tax=Candidatus Synechococcus calcipolaris G9 TaxID=1497997 RepID=A0ABT6EZ00_9SYNE|nr:glycoside hydrolase family protein [Candidatus Synechococcus calcipolaris]MDG2990558.1 glycoside hydrolase family protein [Candidatus Synechococcus calcipolaris G9]
MISLRFQPTAITDNGLIRWHLSLMNGDRPVDQINAYSGAVGAQALNTGAGDFPGSLRPLPPGKWKIGPIEDAGSSWGPAIGRYWIDLLPMPGTQTHGRSAFGIHLDANYHAPRGRGSAGCIVTPVSKDLERVLGWLRAQARPEFLLCSHDQPIPKGQATYTITCNRRAWLDLIAWCEGTDGPDGYRTMFTYRLFSDFSDHPRQIQRSGDLASDAAGRYQFLSTTWDECKHALNLPDFSPASQTQAALWLIDKKRKALEFCDQLMIGPALDRLSYEWASLPAASGRGRYGQPIKSLKQVRDRLMSNLAR